MSDIFAPRPTGQEVMIPTLTGMLIPWRFDGAQLVQMEGCKDYFMPLFSAEDKLRAFMLKAGVPTNQIKQVEDGRVFLDGIPLIHKTCRLRVIVDPYILASGPVRFCEVQRADPELA